MVGASGAFDRDFLTVTGFTVFFNDFESTVTRFVAGFVAGIDFPRYWRHINFW